MNPEESLPLYDAHNHLQDEWLTPHHATVWRDLAAAGVRRAVVNGTCETDWPTVAALAKRHPVVYPSFGLHPWDAGNRTPGWQDGLRAALDADPRAAVGEIGLDRWILDRARPDDPRLAGLRRAPLAEQEEVLVWQLELAAERDLPASIHCLDAFGPLLDVLRTARRPARGFLLHAYSGPLEMVTSFSDLGAYFSFNGSFLDPRKARLQALYARVPPDRLLVETDAPAMRLPAPLERFTLPASPDGALPNHPANLGAVYSGLAGIRQQPLGSLVARLEENFQRLFGLTV